MLHTSLLGRCGACVLRASLLKDRVCTISSLRPQPGLADPRARQGLWGAGCGADSTGRRREVEASTWRQESAEVQGCSPVPPTGAHQTSWPTSTDTLPISSGAVPAGLLTSAVTRTPAPCMLDVLLRAAWCTCRARAWRSSRNSFSPPAEPLEPGGAVEGLEGFSRSGLCTRRHKQQNTQTHRSQGLGTPRVASWCGAVQVGLARLKGEQVATKEAAAATSCSGTHWSA
jgi:hypothetical protein